MSQLISRQTVTIALNASLSGAVTMNGGKLTVIEMPASWTAACLTFQGSQDGTNFFDIYYADGEEVYVIAEANRRIHINITMLSQLKAIKIRSGTASNAVNQLAARTFYAEVWS